MRFLPTRLPGVTLIEPEPHADERGFFARVYCPAEFAAAGIDFKPSQVNLSRNSKALTLRGLHYQDPPHAEAKLVRVTRGRAHDVIVDLRAETPTFRQWITVELDADSARAVLVPEGCAHGFLTLQDGTDVLYQMGRPFTPGQGRGLRWDDPALGNPLARRAACDLAGRMRPGRCSEELPRPRASWPGLTRPSLRENPKQDGDARDKPEHDDVAVIRSENQRFEAVFA